MGYESTIVDGRKRAHGCARPGTQGNGAAAVFLVPVGRIADSHGRKRIYVYGVPVLLA